VLVQPMTYIFDEEPERWQKLLAELSLDEAAARGAGLLNGSHANGNGRA
jgi:ATP phosphoribosyltransferase